ncbi:MAG: hypothetical protein ACJASG_001741, partial [Oleiphilaceae bacterium]
MITNKKTVITFLIFDFSKGKFMQLQSSLPTLLSLLFLFNAQHIHAQIQSSAKSSSGTEIDWISPVEGTSFSEGDELSVEVGATDNGRVSKVRLYLDGRFVRQENIADYEWDSNKDSELSNLAVGPHTLRAEVTDNDDNVTTSSINFTVEAPDHGTNISWVSPIDGAAFIEGYALSVEVGATDNDGIANVMLYLNDHFVRQENSADYEWDSYKDSELANLAVGPHTLRAEVTDNDDNVTTSSINFTVEAPDHGTNISWVSPIDGAAFIEGYALSVEVGATDNDGIANVMLYLNDHFVRQENSADYEWDSYKDSELANLADGPHTLRAEVTDDDDNVTTSSINFTVEASDAQETPGTEETPDLEGFPRLDTRFYVPTDIIEGSFNGEYSVSAGDRIMI